MRTVGEFSRGPIDGFKNIPVDELRERSSEIEKGKAVYLICQSGLRSYIASRILEGKMCIRDRKSAEVIVAER